ncbi:MAG: Gfo/Idh/MocA family oxidoreductase [Planctomycetes bacterium]|nr:Gfo/Idh/MocA family oxidoreductase [Planctomycetota bacterium]
MSRESFSESVSRSPTPKSSRQIRRRAFLGGAALSVALPTLSERVLGANDKVRLGFIGVGNKGRHALGVFGGECADLSEIVSICDVHGGSLASAKKQLKDKNVAVHRDYRALLDQKDVDAVVISTPDHWHALQTIHSAAAGKDLYVEKPLSLRLEEGRAMVRAARRYNRVAQVGLQQRAGNNPDGLFFKAVNIIRGGEIGKVSMVKTWYVANRIPGLGNPPNEDPPKELDWNEWLGPAPYHEYNKNRCLYNFRWFWDYSGGITTDWGTHLIDIVQWAMDGQQPGETRPDVVGALPIAAAAFGGKLVLEDNRETPDTVSAVVQYKNFLLEFEHRAANGRLQNGRRYGIEFYGSKGTLIVDRTTLHLSSEGGKGENLAVERREKTELHRPREHMRDFLRCCRTREKPACDIEIGHRSSSTSQLINVAFHTRQSLHWDAGQERITNLPELNDKLKANYRKPWSLPRID